MKKRKNSVLSILFIFVIVCCVAATFFNSLKGSDVVPTQTALLPVSTETKAATATLTPGAARKPSTATTTPTEDPRPTKTLAPAIARITIKQADVTLNLEERFGMMCGEIEEGEGYYSHYCDKSNSVAAITAIVYGKKITSVDFITANVAQFATPDPTLPADILGFIATIPFVDNSSMQKKAREWVEAASVTFTNEYKEVETNINGIHFKLRGIATSITLEIGYLN